MEEKIIVEIVREWGSLGLVMVLVAKEGWVWGKKYRGKYISWEDMMEKIELMEGRAQTHWTHIEKVKNDLVEHSRQQDIRAVNQEHLKEAITELKNTLKEMRETQTKAFDMIGEIKTFLIKLH